MMSQRISDARDTRMQLGDIDAESEAANLTTMKQEVT